MIHFNDGVRAENLTMTISCGVWGTSALPRSHYRVRPVSRHRCSGSVCNLSYKLLPENSVSFLINISNLEHLNIM